MIKILGVMTGTSCDGLDACCIEAAPNRWRPLWYKSLPYPLELRKRVLLLQQPGQKLSLADMLALDRDIGLWLSTATQKLIQSTPRSQQPDVVAVHGQTVAHFPSQNDYQHTTLQMGDPSRIAHGTRRTTVSHFRNGDQAANGQGAPLAPFFHRALLQSHLGKKTQGYAIHNLGGMSNLTYFGPRSSVLSWDTGPANIWIDAAMSLITDGKENMDRGGLTAKKHLPDMRAVEKVKKQAYFLQAPPKSTGRDDFPFENLLRNTTHRDGRLVATATQITAESIAQDYQKWILAKGFPLKKIFFCGGGAQNNTLISKISSLLPEVEVSTTEELGVHPQQVEAQAFALLGLATLLGKPLGGPWTGAENRACVSGRITPSQNWEAVSKKVAALFKNPPKYL